MSSLIKSFFNRNRSTEPIVIGSRNGEAVLLHWATKSYGLSMYDCGLLDSKDNPSHCVVEVKMRVSPEKIAESLRIAKTHSNMVIWTDFDSEV